MICSKCKELGQKSTMHPGASFVTAAYYAPYYDEEGMLHHHNGNTFSSTYTCSKGHKTIITSKGKCPSCSWGHDSEKVVIKESETLALPDSGIIYFNND